MGPRDLHPDCLAGDGEMVALMRSIDWSATPIGPVAAWSPALRTMVRLLLVNRSPLFLWWGPHYVQFYNDASRSILGAKHPKSMGRPAAECWSEIWHVIGPLIDSPFQGGPATWQEDFCLEINRSGTPEETHFTIAYSPVPDDGVPSGIGGVFGIVHETTGKVVGERRVMVLRDLGSHAAEAKTAEEACVVAARTLASHDKDIPFSLIYLAEANGLSVTPAASSGVDECAAIRPRIVGIDGGGRGWPLAEVLGAGAPRVVPDLSGRFVSVPQGPWSDRPTSAVVLPIPSPKAHQPAGLLVAGVSARLRLDEQYGGFLELVAGQIGAAIANARSRCEASRREQELWAETNRVRERLEAVLSGLSDQFITLDRRWRYVFINDRVCELTGLSREEILGKDVWELFPEVIGTILEAEFRRAAAEGVATQFEYYHEPYGRWFEIRIHPCADGLSLFVADITDRKRAEEALRVANERLDLAIRGSNLGIWDLELAPGGEYRHGPARFINVWEPLGYDPAEFPADASASRALGHPDDLMEVDRAVMACLAGETEEIRVENRIRHKDGSYHSILTLGKAMRDASGRPVRLIGTVLDITDRKRLEVEMRLAKEAAEAANRSKDEFLANVSHEIRTPFGTILGMTELVLESPLTADQRQCLETARSAAEGLLGLVYDLLDFEKIEAGKLELDPADFSLRDTLGAIVRTLAVQAQAKALGLACDLPPDVPDAMVGDADRLRHVLLNLISNAIKFTSQGGVVVRVDVADDTAPEGSVALRVQAIDTGIGIPYDGQGRIFRAFEQVDSSSTRRYGGTGLGLTIAAGLVGLMGGAIGVESEPGRGSTFSFTAWFGRQPDPLDRVIARPSDALHGAATPTPVAAPLRILVAEDSEFNARHQERLLTGWGHAVRVAADGREALELAVGEAFDLLLLDVHMPELDGFQVVREIRRSEQATGGHLPVIALTACARKEDRESCLAAGMDDYLAKPVRAAELFATIGRVAAGGGPRPEPGDRASLLAPATLLAACGNEAGLRALCQDFQAYAPVRLAEVSDASRARDAHRLREAAHKLCGLSSVFSSAAGEVASDLEDHAARGRIDEAMPLVERLGPMLRRLIREVGYISYEGLRSRAPTVEGIEGASSDL